MKFHSFIYVLFFCALTGISSGQSKKDVKKNRVKSCRETETSVKEGKEITADNQFQRFDANGNVTEFIDYDEAGKIKSHETAVFNKDGDKTEEVTFTPD